MKSDTEVRADYSGGSGWDDSNPSVFIITVLTATTLYGEFQLTNGYGLARATQVLQVP